MFWKALWDMLESIQKRKDFIMESTSRNSATTLTLIIVRNHHQGTLTIQNFMSVWSGLRRDFTLHQNAGCQPTLRPDAIG